MKNRYHFICWVCCMLVGITVTRSQEFRRIPSTVAIETSLQLTDLSGEGTASADDNNDHIFHFSENTIAGSASCSHRQQSYYQQPNDLCQCHTCKLNR